MQSEVTSENQKSLSRELTNGHKHFVKMSHIKVDLTE